MVPLIFEQLYPEESGRMRALKSSMQEQKMHIIHTLAKERGDPTYMPVSGGVISNSNTGNNSNFFQRQQQLEHAKNLKYAQDLLNSKWQDKVLFTGAHALLTLERSLKFDGLSIPLLASLARWREAVLSSTWEGLLACAHMLHEAQLSGYMNVPGPYTHAPGPNVRLIFGVLCVCVFFHARPPL
jgi:hypothetical protein